MRVIITFFVLMLLLAAGSLGFIYSGVYNVAASDPHTGPTRWALETALKNSVRARAGDIMVPPLHQQDVVHGFRLFDSLCVICHGAPGIYPSGIGIGLRPKPPELSGHIDHWSAGELYWIAENGFKFTGMPAFDLTHDAANLWNIVAFIMKLPNISAEQYQEFRRELGPEIPGPSQDQQQSPPDFSGEGQPLMIDLRAI